MIDPARLLRALSASASAMIATAPAIGAAGAPPPPVVCQAPVAPPAAYAGWAHPAPAVSGAAGDARVPIGSRVEVGLVPAPGASAGYGGSVRLRIARAGTYRIALGSKAWVDVVSQGAALKPARFGHGPDCTGIRKFVAFRLAPGEVTIRLGDSASPTIALLVAAD